MVRGRNIHRRQNVFPSCETNSGTDSLGSKLLTRCLLVYSSLLVLAPWWWTIVPTSVVILCVLPRTHQVTEGGERACNIHRRQNVFPSCETNSGTDSLGSKLLTPCLLVLAPWWWSIVPTSVVIIQLTATIHSISKKGQSGHLHYDITAVLCGLALYTHLLHNLVTSRSQHINKNNSLFSDAIMCVDIQCTCNNKPS